MKSALKNLAKKKGAKPAGGGKRSKARHMYSAADIALATEAAAEQKGAG